MKNTETIRITVLNDDLKFWNEILDRKMKHFWKNFDQKCPKIAIIVLEWNKYEKIKALTPKNSVTFLW